MHRKGLSKSFSKMLMSYLWVAKIAIFPVTLLLSIFQSITFKKFYNSFKMQSKWNIFSEGSHFSSLWTPKTLCFSFFFTLMFYLIFTIFFTSIYYMRYQQRLTSTFLDHFLHQAYPKSTLSCFSSYLNGQSSVSLTSSQLLQI